MKKMLTALFVGVVVFLCAWVRLDQQVAVIYATLTQGSLTETGLRVRHMDRLMRHGRPGYRAARRFSVKWWSSPPTGYGIAMVLCAEPSFVGMSRHAVISFLGAPTQSRTEPNRETLTYLGSEDLSGEHKTHLDVVLKEGHVAKLERWSEWLIDGHWVTNRAPTTTSTLSSEGAPLEER